MKVHVKFMKASSIGSKQGAFKEKNTITDGYIYNHSNQRRMLTAGIYRCFILTLHKARREAGQEIMQSVHVSGSEYLNNLTL